MQSKINLELKHLVDDFAPIRKILLEIGARRMKKKSQKDYFFNLPVAKDSNIPARMKLRVEKETRTLVYYRRPTFSKTSSTPADVALLEVDDPGLLGFLAKALGIKTIVEKQRELWRKGNTVFNLDTVMGVGYVFEIEVWTKPKTIKADRKKFTEYQRLLLPYLGKLVKGSNEDLVYSK